MTSDGEAYCCGRTRRGETRRMGAGKEQEGRTLAGNDVQEESRLGLVLGKRRNQLCKKTSAKEVKTGETRTGKQGVDLDASTAECARNANGGG